MMTAGTLVATWSERYTAFIERREVAWELAMGAMAAIFVVVGFAADDATGSLGAALVQVEIVLTSIFVAEFGSRIAAAPDRLTYLKGHWIDLVALIPSVRQVRMLRLLRLLRLVRTFASVYRALLHVERILLHRQMVSLFMVWLGIMVLCSVGLYAAENGINEAVNSPLDAIWWGVVTMTTVGYGDVYPVTAEGRLAAIVLMIMGIALFGVITATVTSQLLAAREDSGSDSAARIRALGTLHAEGLLTAEEFATKKRELLARL